MEVRIYWGPTNTGKTHAVYEEFGFDTVYSKDSAWWDGYNSERCVRVDGFCPTRKNQLEYWTEFLANPPTRVRTKRGSVEFCSKVIIFISFDDPTTWWSKVPQSERNRFFNLVTKIQHFNQPYVPLEIEK